jgi:hypothetical protein
MAEETDIITIRVPKSLKNKLEERSKKNGNPLNLTLNKILEKETKWDEYLSEMGWLQFDPSTVRIIFSLLNESQIKEIAKKNKHDIISSIKFIYENPSYENTVDFIESWYKAANMPFRHIKNENSHKFIVNHDLGKNWSIFAIAVTNEFLSELGFIQTNTSIESKAYTFEILQKKI